MVRVRLFLPTFMVWSTVDKGKINVTLTIKKVTLIIINKDLRIATDIAKVYWFSLQYRPSRWQWRRGEPRYTAASIHMWKRSLYGLLWYYYNKNWISPPRYNSSKYSYKIIKEDFDTKLCLRRYPAVIFLKLMNVTNVLQDSLVNLISLNTVL